MLARPTLRENATRACCMAMAWLAACSNVPRASFPPYAERAIAAEFVVPADGLLPMPRSSWSLVVHELQADPPPLEERFAEGSRWFVYPAGAAVVVHCRYRAYAGPDGRLAEPADVLPGASRLRTLEAP